MREAYRKLAREMATIGIECINYNNGIMMEKINCKTTEIYV